MHSGRSMDLEVTFTLMEFPVFVYSFAGTWTGIFFSIQSINLKFDLTCCVVVFFFFNKTASCKYLTFLKCCMLGQCHQIGHLSNNTVCVKVRAGAVQR